jgi:hypothetical protein
LGMAKRKSVDNSLEVGHKSCFFRGKIPLQMREEQRKERLFEKTEKKEL